MSKKVKCVECVNCMRFAIPKTYWNPNGLKNRIVCAQTNKTKLDDNEQYCKHYHEASDLKKKQNSHDVYVAEVDKICKEVPLGSNNIKNREV